MAGSPASLLFLRHSVDIDRVKQSGRRVSTPLFNLMSSRTDREDTRIAVIVGRRMGGAVVRNRAKRIFRELARQSAVQLAAGRDVLVFPRREALAARHAGLRDLWFATLKREGLLRDARWS
jgi:ribonuclease P protein component